MDEILIKVALDGTKKSLSSLISEITSNETTQLSLWSESDKRVKLITQRIAQALSNDPRLKKLCFWDSSFGDKGAIDIASELPKLSRLAEVNLDAKFGNKGAVAICTAVAGMANITSLTLHAPFSDEGVEAVMSLIERRSELKCVDILFAKAGMVTYQRLLQVLKNNTSVEKFCFPRGGSDLKTVPAAWIEDCFSVNRTLAIVIPSPACEPIVWFADRNRICNEMGVDKKLRDIVPRAMRKSDEIRKFLQSQLETAKPCGQVSKQVDAKEHQALLEEVARLREQLSESKSNAQPTADQLQQCKNDTKKEIAKSYMEKAYNMLEQVRLSEAMCLLQCALDLDNSVDAKKEGTVLKGRIEEQMKLSEHEQQMHIEMKIATIKAEIVHADEQARKVRSEEEREMIKQQLDVLHKMEDQLKERLSSYDARQKELEERVINVERQEMLVVDQTKQLEQLLSELAVTNNDETSALQQQMSAVATGDQDVDAARRRFASLQKSAKDAQQRLKVEERRQHERVEWMQRQMELYKMKGMSPSQLSFRNYLKDVKHISILRHLKDHMPHPLRCFISYAWETDTTANKALQERLQRLKDELKVAGMEVTLDIRNMKDDMKKFMVQGISEAHKVLLICTPRLKVRAAETTKNNLQLELSVAMDKARNTPDFIVPLILSGTFRDAMPADVEHLLSVNLTSQTDYYAAMASIAPTGLIPMLLGLEDNKDYKRVHDRFFGDLEDYAKHSKA